jgi:hypothetical protein
MKKDPILEEIHKVREEHARKFDYDLHAMFEDIRKREAKRENLSTLKPVQPALSRVAETRADYQTGQSTKS